MKKAIIFDLWETLGTKNVIISKSLQEKFGIPLASDFPRRYERAVQLHQWGSEEEMAKGFLSEFGLEQKPESITFVVDLFKKGITNATLFEGIYELLVTLKQKGYKLGLLSNTTIFESVVLEKLGIRDFFDAAVFSWHKRILKPAPEAFEHILAELEVAKEEALFIDDTQKNITSAESYGLEAVTFESVPQLTQELHGRGIL